MRAHDSTRHLPLLVLGRIPEQPRLIKGLELGVNDYLLKQLDANELRARVRTQVRRRRFQLRMQATHESILSIDLTDGLTGHYTRHYFSSPFDHLLYHRPQQYSHVSVPMMTVSR